MRREVSQFKNGRSARSGNNMHFVYYDKYNNAIRYSYQKVTSNTYSSNDVSSATANANNTDITGWILIDGTSDGQDRVHTTSIDIIGNTATNAGGTNNISVNKRNITLSTSYSVTVGDTIGFAYTNTSGVYSAEIHTITKVGNKTSGTETSNYIEWSDYDFANGDVSNCTGWTIYRGSSNVVTNGASLSSSAGSYLALDVTSGGKPVIVYYDAASEGLRIAYSTSATPSMTEVSTGRDTWTRQTISGVSGGTYVQAKIDGSNYLHIMYRDSDGKLCYLKSTNAPDGAAYTFGSPMTIDSSGTYGTLSVMNTGTTEDPVYVPCVSWLNSEGTANGVKYALLRDVDTGSGSTESLWDVQIVPAVVDGGNHYVSGGELVYVEGKSGSWSATEDNVSIGDCDAVVGFNTGRMDVVFLKSEK